MKKGHSIFKKVTVFMLLLFAFAGTSLAQPQYYNYNGTSGSNSFPLNQNPGKMVQWLIAAGEFNVPSPAPNGNITSFSLMISSTGSRTYTNFYILMGQTTDITLPTGAFYTGPLDTVYFRASVMFSGTLGQFLTIALDTPFPYDNTKSLVVQVEQCGSTGTGMSVAQTTLTGFRRSWSLTNMPCPWSYQGQSGTVLNCGIDVAPPAVDCNYAWSVQTSGTSSALYSVKAVNNLVGWAAGVGGTVRKTVDGGTTWTDGNPNPGVITGDIYAIDALGPDTAWCTTSPSASNVYRTVNGGVNWTQVHTQTGGFFNAMKFINSSTGFMEGDPVGGRWSLWKSTDGGATWDSSGLFNPQAGSEAGWNNSVFAEGNNIWYGTNNTRVYYSTDFGATFGFGATTGTANTYNIHYTPAVGLAGGTAIVKTTDGGATYTNVGTIPGTGNVSGIEGKGSDFWYIRGTGIYRSTNAGDNWASEYTSTGALNDVDFADDGSCLNGWAVGSAGTINRVDGTVSGVIGNNGNTQIPSSFKLNQNFPNPFNPTTTISFSIPVSGQVELKVFDILGKEVATLINAPRLAGSYRIDFNGLNLSSGVYIYRLKSGDFIDSKKMLLVK